MTRLSEKCDVSHAWMLQSCDALKRMLLQIARDSTESWILGRGKGKGGKDELEKRQTKDGQRKVEEREREGVNKCKLSYLCDPGRCALPAQWPP